MHVTGLWNSDGVVTDDWFADNEWTMAFWCDCFVAQGMIGAFKDQEGHWLYGPLNIREVQ
jgi:hypothetical protein